MVEMGILFRNLTILAILIFVSSFGFNCEIGKDKETGSSSRACSEAWKLHQLCKALNGNDSTRACDTQWAGVVYSCGMM